MLSCEAGHVKHGDLRCQRGAALGRFLALASALAFWDVAQAPMFIRTCTLRGRPSDAPLKNGPLSAYL